MSLAETEQSLQINLCSFLIQTCARSKERQGQIRGFLEPAAAAKNRSEIGNRPRILLALECFGVSAKRQGASRKSSSLSYPRFSSSGRLCFAVRFRVTDFYSSIERFSWIFCCSINTQILRALNCIICEFQMAPQARPTPGSWKQALNLGE